jgi:hypothetical protein
MASSAFAKEDIPAEARTAGMKAAPALIAATHLTCTLADARMMGTSADKTNFYEVACKDGVGYVIIAKPNVPPTTYDCVMASEPLPDGKPNNMACKLPGNLNPGATLTPAMAALGRSCAVSKAHYIGSTNDLDIYEVACTGGGDYVLQKAKAAGGTSTAKLCAVFGAGSNIKCILTTPDQQAVDVDNLAAAAPKPCQVKDRRYVGSTPDQTDFFEVACAGNVGYMLQVDPRGKVQQTIDCIKAADLAGGCTLTDTRQAQTEQTAIYSDLAKKAGFDCAVSKYAEFPPRADGAEVVELACSNRMDGGVGIFPPKGSPQVLDCLRAAVEGGYTCTFSDVNALDGKLSDQLKAKGKGSCTVSGARPYGQTSTGSDLIEVACADGGPGWVLEYTAGASTPANLINCAQAATMGGGGCQLPTNKKH